MVYCKRKKEFINPEYCSGCIFDKLYEDSCQYKNWHPGLIKGKNEDK